MTKLTDTQRVILSAASQRTDRLALPLPKSLKGGAAHKVINALIEKGLLKEVKANRKLSDPVWRENEEGHGLNCVRKRRSRFSCHSRLMAAARVSSFST